MDLEDIKRGLRGEIKKRENEQYFTLQTNIRQMCKDVLAKLEEQESVIADKDAEIAELKVIAKDACLERDDNQKVIDELESENRKLKRALWLARAERAVAEQTVDEWSRYKEKHPFGSWRADPFEYWMQAWICVEKICRKKAEEYK